MYKIDICVKLLHSRKIEPEYLIKKIEREKHLVAHSSSYPISRIRLSEDVRRNKVFEFTLESSNNDFDDAEKKVSKMLKEVFIRSGVNEEDIKIEEAIFVL